MHDYGSPLSPFGNMVVVDDRDPAKEAAAIKVVHANALNPSDKASLLSMLGLED